MKIFHTSDYHFTDDLTPDLLGKLHDSISKYPAHLKIVTGDIVDSGKVDQYERASNFFNPFRENLLICPGNHDWAWEGNIYEQKAADAYGFFENQILTAEHSLWNYRAEHCQFVKVITPFHSFLDHDFACGKVGEGQLVWLRAALMNRRDQRNRSIVYFHHHPIFHTDPTMKLLDAEALMEVLRECHVDIVLFGHQHKVGKWENYEGIPLMLACGRTTEDGSAWSVDTETMQAELVNLL